MKMHGGLRFALPCLIILYLLFPSGWTARPAKADENDISFRWAFGAMVGGGSDRRLVAITRDTVLKTGDRLKMLIELQKKCFVYVIHHSSSNDELVMLFPYEMKQFDTDYRTGKKYYIPQGDAWFELDSSVGLETFHLIASSDRLGGLETSLGRYESAKAAEKTGIAREILREIRELKRQHRRLETVAERPVVIGGNVRGMKGGHLTSSPDLDPIAGEVSAGSFFSRTLTIEHQ